MDNVMEENDDTAVVAAEDRALEDQGPSSSSADGIHHFMVCGFMFEGAFMALISSFEWVGSLEVTQSSLTH